MTNTRRKPTQTPVAATAPDPRARLIRLVHVARRDLGMDEPTYRSMLMAQTGLDSAAGLSEQQLQRVVDHLKRSGFKIKITRPAAVGRGVVRTTLASDPQARKARAMWLMLHAIGQVRDPSEAALLAYAKRLCKVDRLEWVRDTLPLIESLKAWCLRSLPAVVEPYLQQPMSVWAGHMDSAFCERFVQAVRRLRMGQAEGYVQLLDEWVALWELTVLAKEARK